MTFVPGLFLICLILLALTIRDDPLADTMQVALLEKRSLVRLLSDDRYLIVATILVILASLIALIIQKPFWNYPLTFDPSSHLYVGWDILNGGVPYRTFVVPYPPLRYVISLFGI